MISLTCYPLKEKDSKDSKVWRTQTATRIQNQKRRESEMELKWDQDRDSDDNSKERKEERGRRKKGEILQSLLDNFAIWETKLKTKLSDTLLCKDALSDLSDRCEFTRKKNPLKCHKPRNVLIYSSCEKKENKSKQKNTCTMCYVLYNNPLQSSQTHVGSSILIKKLKQSFHIVKPLPNSDRFIHLFHNVVNDTISSHP